MISKIFFFNENSTKEQIITNLNTKDETIILYIDTICKMKTGNKVGYFQFLNKDIYYKFYIMPKIYKVTEGESEDIEEYKNMFINFFKHYYKLLNKYNIQHNFNSLEGNISDITYQTKKSKFKYEEVKDIDDFIIYNYVEAISYINNFFNKHNKYTIEEKDYQSQSIRNKLNLKKNILSIQKNNIHQTKKTPLIYSKIAIIATTVLENFIEKKIKNFSNSEKSRQLKKVVNQVLNKIRKKFSIKNETFILQEILSNHTIKLFSKNLEYKKIYKALLKLSSKEHYYNGDKYVELKKEEETISLFFQPEKLYEWIVYDKLVESNEFDKVLKCDKDNIKKDYLIIPNKQNYSSEPDIIVVKNDEVFPIDVKWKILSKKESSFDNDIFKLRRDSLIRNVNKGYLIYPLKTDKSIFEENIQYNYSFDSTFNFEIKVMTV